MRIITFLIIGKNNYIFFGGVALGQSIFRVGPAYPGPPGYVPV